MSMHRTYAATERKSDIPDGDEDESSSAFASSPSASACAPASSDMDTKDDEPSSAKAAAAAPPPVASASSAPPTPCPDTVIIFDWDDTLLASSFLSSRGYRLDTSMEKSPEADLVDAQLRELETAVEALLTLALSYGHVHVVTNAETGWVQLSAQKFMPGLVPLLSRVNIISARSTFEPAHPDSPLKWKFFAFQEKLSAHFNSADYKCAPGVKKNVVSFGDSHVEREAVRAVTRAMPSTRCKSVKFAERPSMEQLRRQLELVTNCFHYIHHHDGDLDLQLTVTVNSPPPSPIPPVAGNLAAPVQGYHAAAPVALPTVEVA
jgi:hypothetical protein